MVMKALRERFNGCSKCRMQLLKAVDPYNEVRTIESRCTYRNPGFSLFRDVVWGMPEL